MRRALSNVLPHAQRAPRADGIALSAPLRARDAACGPFRRPRPCDLSAPPQLRIAQRLRELRVDAELTQAEVARRTGIQRPVIARIERGMHMCSLETLTRIAGALDLDMETVCVVLDPAWCASALAC